MGATAIDVRNRAVRNISSRARTLVSGDVAIRGGCPVALPRVAREPRREMRALENQFFGFGHTVRSASRFFGRHVASAFSGDHRGLLSGRYGIVALTRSCMAASRSGSSVSGPRRAAWQAARIGMPPGDEPRRRDNQACARYLGETTVAELAQTIGQRDERDRRVALDRRPRARRSRPRPPVRENRTPARRSAGACWA